MKKSTLILFLTLPLFCSAQVWDVVASGGASVEQNGSSLCYTVGEAVIWQANGSSYNAQQGFQQPDLDFGYEGVGIEDLSDFQHSPLIVYPNPAVSAVWVRGFPAGTSTLSVFNSEGKHVLNLTAAENGSIDLSSLAAGRYTIALFDTENHTVYSNSIIKTNQ